MKRYEVTVILKNNRKNTLIIWADNEQEAITIACKSWGCIIYKSITARDTTTEYMNA